jgi:hypothetical protein
MENSAILTEYLNKMITNEKELFRLTDKILLPVGFIRKSNTYYITNEETICFFLLNKSEFSGYYENLLGCFYKPLMLREEAYPKFFKNHLKISLQGILDPDHIKSYLI